MKNKKIVLIIAVLAILTVSFFMSGSPSGSKHRENSGTEITQHEEKVSHDKGEDVRSDEGEISLDKKDESESSDITQNEDPTDQKSPSEYEQDKKDKKDNDESKEPKEPSQAEPKKESHKSEDKKNTTTQEKPNQEGKDKYLTDPVPEGKPLPIEPQDVIITDKQMTATLSVRCDTLLDNLDKMNQEKVELVPKDGVIFPATKVTFYEGESVFNILQREMKKNKIHMEFENTPKYNSAYIEGIHNLYEFDGGELSGWMYKVNGWYPNYGCSRYQVKEGDLIEWVYTCDLGRDVGGYIPGVEN